MVGRRRSGVCVAGDGKSLEEKEVIVMTDQEIIKALGAARQLTEADAQRASAKELKKRCSAAPMLSKSLPLTGWRN